MLTASPTERPRRKLDAIKVPSSDQKIFVRCLIVALNSIYDRFVTKMSFCAESRKSVILALFTSIIDDLVTFSSHRC